MRLAVAEQQESAVADQGDSEGPAPESHPAATGRVWLDLVKVGDRGADHIVADPVRRSGRFGPIGQLEWWGLSASTRSGRCCG